MSQSAKTLTENAIKTNKVMVFSKSYCPYCAKTKSTLKGLGIQYGLVELDVRKRILNLLKYPDFNTFDL